MKLKNKFLSAGLALSVLLTGIPEAKAMSFEDSYNYLIENDYVRNYSTGEFLPSRHLTRDEASWLLSLSLFDYKFNSKDTSSFGDVKEGDFYIPYIEKTKRLEVMNGTSPYEFKPQNKITRYQTAAILNRAFKVKDTRSANNCFPDIPSNHWAKNDVCALKELEVIQGANGEFKGNNNVTKAQFSMMYARMLNTEFYLNEIDYVFEKEVLNNFYIHKERNLVKVNPDDKLTLEVIQKMIKVDKVLKGQKEFLGPNLEKLMEVEPLAFALTSSKYIGGNGGIYNHKGQTSAATYMDNEPDKHLIAVTNDFNEDYEFKRIFIHELGHYLGYSALHKNKDYTEFGQFKDLTGFNPNGSYIPNWGEREIEALADSYTEIAVPGFENRTFVGSFKTQAEKLAFAAWVKQKINEVVYSQ